MHLVTDGCASFSAAGREVAAHGAIIVGHRKSSELEPVKLARRGRTQPGTRELGGQLSHLAEPSLRCTGSVFWSVFKGLARFDEPFAEFCFRFL